MKGGQLELGAKSCGDVQEGQLKLGAKSLGAVQEGQLELGAEAEWTGFTGCWGPLRRPPVSLMAIPMKNGITAV